jgi:Flp pilus assembly protein TadG
MQTSSQKTEKAQGMVEFALVLPMLLLVVFGVIEFGRLLFTYSAVYTASREAARYGSAAGDVGGYVAHYQDCNGIRSAAKRIGGLVGVNDANITITYDQGAITSTLGTCPVNGVGPQLALGNRVSVMVSTQYRPIVPLVGVPAFPITSTSSRTIIKNVSIQGDPAAGEEGALPVVYFEVEEHSMEEDEEDGWELEVKLSESTENTVTVNLEVTGSAAQGSDFILSDSVAVTISPGEEEAEIYIYPLDDEIDEYDETINITIASTVNATRSAPYVHTTTIVDDDAQPSVTFTVSQSVGENEPEFYLLATLMNGGSETVSGKEVRVPYTLNGSAVQSSDYQPGENPIVVSPGAANAYAVMELIDDAVYELDETMVATMGTPDNASAGPVIVHTATIRDDEAPPRVSFTTEEQTVSELSGVVVVTVQLSNADGTPALSSQQVSVSYSAAGSAQVDSDYNMPAGPLVIQPGNSEASFAISLVNDGLPEADETIELTLSNPANATLVAPTEQTVIITNDTIAYFNAEAQEGQEGAASLGIQVELTPPQNAPVAISFTVAGSATLDEDYTLSHNGQIVISAGQSSATLTVSPINDGVDEDDETIEITLQSSDIAMLGTPSLHVLTLIDNDLPPTVRFVAAGQPAAEINTTLSAQVILSAASSYPITLPFGTSGSASLGLDYTVNPAQEVVIPPGETSAVFSINILDDGFTEGEETATITLQNVQNAVAATPFAHTVTIGSSDQPVCNIMTSNELVFNTAEKYFSWTLSNLGTDTLVLKSLTVWWPTNASPAPKFDKVKFGGVQIWDGNESFSPATVTSWDGYASDRRLTGVPAEIKLYLTRTPLFGPYKVSLIFRNETSGVDCTAVEKTKTLP